MTRETKIGLLVGLAFIIIVGLLLSDPLRNAGETQLAPLPGVAQNVRNSVVVPGATPANPPITMAPTRNVAPEQPVPTREEVARRNQGDRAIGVIEIGVGPGQAQTPLRANGYSTARAGDAGMPNDGGGIVMQSANPRQPPAAQPRVLQQPRQAEIAGGVDASAMPAQDAAQPARPDQRRAVAVPGIAADREAGIAADPRMREARLQGEELVFVDASGRPANNRAGGNLPSGVKPAAPVGQKYTAAPGDSLSKIAARFYGQGTKAAMDAIVAANPSLQQDRNKVIVGQTYLIPTAPADNSAVDPAVPATPQAPRVVMADASTRRAAEPEYFYTVKESDSLWRIAKEQLGSGAAVAAIKELNKDVLKGGDVVTPNMKLRLPSKPVN